MLYTSAEFLIFAAVLLILYHSLPRVCKPYLLLLSSAVFFTSYAWYNLPFLLFTVIVTYTGALTVANIYDRGEAAIAAEELDRETKKARRKKINSRAKLAMAAFVTVDIAVLAVLKYYNFTLQNLNSLLHFAANERDMFITLALPLGISFYTFMCVGYIVDVYRKKYKAERNILKVALFASYFPQLVQGPFSRYDETGAQLWSPPDVNGDRLSWAALRIAWGYFKKLVLADRVAVAVNMLAGSPDSYRGAYVFAAIVLYSLRIYADFTGGIDITIGLSEALGIKLTENFIRPYFAKSIAEYWRRWHISLGEWFREYLFYPLSIAGPTGKASKWVKAHIGAGAAKRFPVYVATIVTWFVTGIWHGAAWNFIAWGMANCIVILISQELSPLYEKFHSKTGIGESGAWGAFMILRTYLLMGMIRMFDVYADVGATVSAIGSMFTTWNISVLFDGSMLTLGLTFADYLLLFAGAALIFITSVLGEKKPLRDRTDGRYALRVSLACALAVMTLIFGAYGIGYDASQFIYNQF